MSPGSHIYLNQKVRNETKSGKLGRAGVGVQRGQESNSVGNRENENQREEKTEKETRKPRLCLEQGVLHVQ